MKIPALVLTLALGLALCSTASADDTAVNVLRAERAIDSLAVLLDELGEGIDIVRLSKADRARLAHRVDDAIHRVKSFDARLSRGDRDTARTVIMDREEAVDDLRDADRALAKYIDGLRRQKSLGRDGKRLIDIAQKTRGVLSSLERDIQRGPATLRSPKHPTKTGPEAIDARSFSALLKIVRDNAFDKQKVQLVRDATRSGNHFTIDQTLALLDAFTFDSDRVSAAIALYPNTLDKKSWFRVYGLFVHDSDKKKLRRAVEAIKP